MQATNSLSNSLRALTSRIHPQLPLTPRESSQLLGILTASFNKQLDIHHPTSLSDNAIIPSQQRPSELPNISRLSAAVSANDHLSSLLASPLLSKRPRTASFSKPNLETVAASALHLQRQLAWLEDKIASGIVTVDDFAVTLSSFRAALASHPESTLNAIKDLSAGSKILRWIRTSGRTSERDIMGAGKSSGPSNLLRNTLVDILVIESRQDLVWHWLNYAVKIPKSSIFARLLFAEIRFGSGVEAAMVAFMDAPSRGYHGPRSAAPIGAHYLSAAPRSSSPEIFVRFWDTLRSQPANSFSYAVMSLFHPDGPSTKEGMAYVTAQSNKALATGEVDVTQALRRRHVAFYLKLAGTLLSRGQTESTVFVLRFAQEHFPRELGIEEKQFELQSRLSASGSKSLTSEEENLLQLDGLLAT